MTISDDDYRKGKVRASEVATQIEIDTGVEVRIDPKAKPMYRGIILLKKFQGQRNLSVDDITLCMSREFLPFPEKIWVKIAEIDDETVCTVIIKERSYKAFVTAIKHFFNCPEGKVSTAEAVISSFAKFCNLKDKPLVVLDHELLFLTKRKI